MSCLNLGPGFIYVFSEAVLIAASGAKVSRADYTCPTEMLILVLVPGMAQLILKQPVVVLCYLAERVCGAGVFHLNYLND